MSAGKEERSSLGKFCVDHLQCSICLGPYTDPKVLDCQHSFCKRCLEEFWNTFCKHGPKISCPECKRETRIPAGGVDDLKTNFHLRNIVEDFPQPGDLVKPQVNCETCDKGNKAKHRCLDCQQNICSDCCSIHLKCKGTMGHKIDALADTSQGEGAGTKPQEGSESHCPKHKERRHFYCETCKMLICVVCSNLDHRGHCYIETAEASLKYKQALTAEFPVLNEEIQELQKSVGTIRQARQGFLQNITRTKEEAKDGGDKIRSEVLSEECKITDGIEQLQEVRDYNEHERMVCDILKSKLQLQKTAQEATNTTSDYAFLSCYHFIRHDIESLREVRPPKLDSALLYPRFMLRQEVSDVHLDELQVVESQWELCQEFGKKESGHKEDPWFKDIISYGEGEIAVADFNRRVVIYSMEGILRAEIYLDKGPCSIAEINNLLVVVDGTPHVKMVKRNAKLALKFTTKEAHPAVGGEVDAIVKPCSVVVKKNGNIIVGDIARKVLTEHSPTDGALLQTMPVQTKPYFLAVDCCTDRFVISDLQSSLVVITNSKGITLFTIWPIVDGRPVESCRGTCCDASGIYIAVDNEADNTGHIHHYDRDGGFLSCLARNLHYPQGMAFMSDGRLAVADYNTVKMYHKLSHSHMHTMDSTCTVPRYSV